MLRLLALAALASSCAGPIASLYPPRGDEPRRSVWVVRHDWHTGLVVRRADVSADVWPERDDFPGAEYLEVGWGDRDFYRAPRGTLWLGLKAALWPTDSVLHVAGFTEAPARFFAGREVVEIELSTRGFGRLAAFIGAAHARTREDRAIPLGPGWYGESQFYLGRERFLLTTCNVWTARALRASGFPITPLWALTARNVMFQIESARPGRAVHEQGAQDPPHPSAQSPAARPGHPRSLAGMPTPPWSRRRTAGPCWRGVCPWRSRARATGALPEPQRAGVGRTRWARPAATRER